MTRKKRKRFAITAVLIIFCIGIAASSSEVMLRAAVFCNSPISAIVMNYEAGKAVSNSARLYKITENAPIEGGTKGELTTWIVYRFGPFHYARYFGEA